MQSTNMEVQIHTTQVQLEDWAEDSARTHSWFAEFARNAKQCTVPMILWFTCCMRTDSEALYGAGRVGAAVDAVVTVVTDSR